MKGMAKLKTAAFAPGLTGSMSNLAFRETRQGTQMIVRQAGRNPRTPGQLAARDRMARASRAWVQMTVEQAEAWRSYAASLATNPLAAPPVAFNVFASLAVRALQANPSASIPLNPPPTPFSGDAVAASVSAGPGAVVLHVLSGNAEGVVTEVLVQKVASAHRAAYLEKYRSKGFSSWVAGASLSVPVKPGVYAVAIRAVKASTGQSGELMEIGRVVV